MTALDYANDRMMRLVIWAKAGFPQSWPLLRIEQQAVAFRPHEMIHERNATIPRLQRIAGIRLRGFPQSEDRGRFFELDAAIKAVPGAEPNNIVEIEWMTISATSDRNTFIRTILDEPHFDLATDIGEWLFGHLQSVSEEMPMRGVLRDVTQAHSANVSKRN